MTWFVYDGVTKEMRFWSDEGRARRHFEECVETQRSQEKEGYGWDSDIEDSCMGVLTAMVSLEPCAWEAKIRSCKEAAP